MNYGYIQMTQEYDGNGTPSPAPIYEWVGGDVAEISSIMHGHLSDKPVKRNDVITLGALRLRVVEPEDMATLSVKVMRDGWRAWVHVVVYWITFHLEMLYYRLMLTAGIWGLADNPRGERVSWRNLKPVKWWLSR
jgi:hypothetical protein